MLEMSCSQTTGAHMFCKVNSTIMFLSLYMLGHNALEITVFTLYFILNASIYYLPYAVLGFAMEITKFAAVFLFYKGKSSYCIMYILSCRYTYFQIQE